MEEGNGWEGKERRKIDEEKERNMRKIDQKRKEIDERKEEKGRGEEQMIGRRGEIVREGRGLEKRNERNRTEGRV